MPKTQTPKHPAIGTEVQNAHMLRPETHVVTDVRHRAEWNTAKARYLPQRFPDITLTCTTDGRVTILDDISAKSFWHNWREV